MIELSIEDTTKIVRNSRPINPASKSADMAEMESNRRLIRHIGIGVNAATVDTIQPGLIVNRYALDHENWEDIKDQFTIVQLSMPAIEEEPLKIIRHFLDLGVPLTIEVEDGRHASVLRTFLGIKNSYGVGSNRELYTVPRSARSATVTKRALAYILEVDPQDVRRAAALTQTLVYGAKVVDAAKQYGQSVDALTKHRQRILHEIRLKFPEEVTEVEPTRVKFQHGQFDRGIGPGTDPRRWEDAKSRS
jgi:hypothetical protein